MSILELVACIIRLQLPPRSHWLQDIERWIACEIVDTN